MKPHPILRGCKMQDQNKADCGQINSRNIPNSDYLAGFELRKSSKWSLYGTFEDNTKGTAAVYLPMPDDRQE